MKINQQLKDKETFKLSIIFKIMRNTVIFLLVSISVALADTSYSQNTLFTLKHSNISILNVLGDIRKNSEYVFFYSDEIRSELNKKVNIDVSSKTLEEILNIILKSSGLTYNIHDRQVTIYKSALPPIIQQPTKKTYAGRVTDERGEPLIGVNVLEKGTTNGTTTDIDGFFSLTSSESNVVLLFSYIGYASLEFKPTKNEILKIRMKEDAKNIEEVVVVGYGQQKKESLVGSVQSIRPAELQIPSASLSTGFAGRLAGVIAVQRNGQPGADQADFWIRGISTFGSATKPLVVLDGVAIDINELNGLDPEIIESFSVLKDATATALYGTRGANGVMIVTTKSGKSLDKPIINFRVEAALSSPNDLPQMADGITYMKMYNEAILSRGTGEIPYTEDKINGTINQLDPYLYPDVDWYNEMFKKVAVNENFNFNIRGGGSKVDYFMSATVRHEDGLLRGLSKDYFSYNNNYSVYRYAFQNNVNVNISSSSKVSLKINTQLRDTHGPSKSSNSIFGMIMNGNAVDMPISFPANPEVNHIQWGGKQTVYNPVAEMVTGYQDAFQSVLNANLEYEQKLDFVTKGLKASALISFKNYSFTSSSRSSGYNKYVAVGSHIDENGETIYDLERYGDEAETTLKTTNSTDSDRKFYLQAMINWERIFGKHNVTAMLLYNQEETAMGNPTSLFQSLPKRKQGLAGRITYAFDERYLLEANFGYNGSENFAKGKRFGFFPSVAVGYRLSAEKFWQPILPVISNLKLRASYGLVGNDSEGTRFMYMSEIDLNGRSYITGADASYSASGPVYKRYMNNDITWETGKKLNVGIDLQFYSQANFMIDVFQEKRDGIFMARGTIPEFLGAANTTVYGNLGKVTNRGFDLAADYTHQINKDLYISAKATFTYAHNTVTEQDEPDFLQYPNLSRVGHSVNSNLLYQAERLFIDENEIANSPSQLLGGTIMPGDIKYTNIADVNGEYDNVIDANDRLYSGYPTVPEIVYGFGPSLQWKKFDFSLFFQGVARTSLVMSGFHPFGNSSYSKRNVMQFIADDYWSESNPNIYAGYPRLSILDYKNNMEASTYWLRNAAFLKLKNAEIGYTIHKMRFYISGSNLVTFSPFKLWDPEQGGGSGLKYPTQRVFNIGFQMTL